ncbi:hypothetical protein L3Q82_001555 [Scortum barcoo]|uniref:Uncharacterized protein n=1 Tax=Scortum barcoo TaxID=214431 RepID=A0ACB8W818_9TELE|nr:hypothetical protein L3Q82_001555 [Scortum barcoo]
MKVLVSTYKADQKKGKKGEKRKEKRQMELGILQLFEEEGQRLIEAANEKLDQVKKPPPYEKEVKFKEIYPQLPVICQEGNYRIRDDEDCIIEEGQAETTIKMYPTTKAKRRMRRLETEGGLRMRRLEFGSDEDQSDLEEAMGGYDPAVRRMLAKAEKRGSGILRRKEPEDDSSNEIYVGICVQSTSSPTHSEKQDLPSFEHGIGELTKGTGTNTLAC